MEGPLCASARTVTPDQRALLILVPTNPASSATTTDATSTSATAQ